MFPNPASNLVNLNLKADGHLKVINLTGQVVLQTPVSAGNVSRDIRKLQVGAYLIHFMGSDATNETGRLIVKSPDV